MKNKMMEAKKQRMLSAAKGQRKGIFILHCYEEKTPDSLTWWDDFSFHLNGIRHTVCFIHPRMKYKDECEKIVWDKLYPSYPKNDVAWKPYSTKKLGNSRKKITGFTMEDSNKEAMNAWHKNLWEQQEGFLVNKDNGVVARPSVRVEWWNYSKGIEICVPYSITSYEEAEFFVLLVRSMYASGRLYEWVDKMQAITYDVNNWNTEQEKRK